MPAEFYLPRIIVNADDFGLHPSLNDAIELAHREGVVTSASVMTEGPAFLDAVRRARTLPALDLGLHFTLVGLPGLPPTFAAFFQDYWQGRISAADIAASLRMQMQAALITHRLPISHLDSHQHLHAFPPIMRIVCRIAEEHGLRLVRLPSDGPAWDSVGAGRRMQAMALRAMCVFSRRILAVSGLRTTDHFSGMAVSGHLSPGVLMQYLRHAGPGATEIVCHPGTDNATLTRTFPWQYDWEGELAALCSPEVRSAADNRQVRLIAWHEL